MKTIDIVIGANYGDEGKGLITDFIASNTNDSTIVVRHNGGSQAGHTVWTPKGDRHVFHHIPSGVFANAYSYLSEHFIVNPFQFLTEYEGLSAKTYIHPILVHPFANVTTPYDVIINQVAEQVRTQRHGSCGLGINETVNRSLWNPGKYKITVESLKSKDLSTILKNIRDIYVPYRFSELGIHDDQIPEFYQDIIQDDATIDKFIQMADDFLKLVRIRCYDSLEDFSHVIFEGAQGLMLDQNKMEYYPHLTRSNTGIQNAIQIIENEGFSAPIQITYVTRAYLTRHGAGPLNNELVEKPYSKIVDLTNIPHDYQGAIRFAPLNIGLLRSTINTDLLHAKCVNSYQCIAVTCLDQIDDQVQYMHNLTPQKCPPELFAEHLRLFLRFNMRYSSYGPSRDHIIL